LHGTLVVGAFSVVEVTSVMVVVLVSSGAEVSVVSVDALVEVASTFVDETEVVGSVASAACAPEAPVPPGSAPVAAIATPPQTSEPATIEITLSRRR
jgi:hypothetical protein